MTDQAKAFAEEDMLQRMCENLKFSDSMPLPGAVKGMCRRVDFGVSDKKSPAVQLFTKTGMRIQHFPDIIAVQIHFLYPPGNLR